METPLERATEVISLHIGQAGVQTGNACWELYCLEHGVMPNGTNAPGAKRYKNDMIFNQTSNGLNVPRAVFADLEPSVIDEIRVGAFSNLFKQGSLVSGKEDAASNFARGYYSVGNEMSELVMEALRQQAEQADSLQGFLVFRSFGGGTGSGLTPNLMGKMKRDYGNKKRLMEFSVYPSPQISPVIVEPYNAVLTTHSCMELSSCCFIMDNEALFDICANKLNVVRPTYTNLNRLIGQVVSGVTSSLRFPGGTNTSLEELMVNLIPFPRLHFPLVTYSPLVPMAGAQFEQITETSLVSSCFRPETQMVKCDPTTGKYASCCFLFRGQVEAGEVDQAVAKLKDNKTLEFVDYAPTGFKIGMSKASPKTVPGGDLGKTDRAVVMLSNTSAIETAWSRINRKFSTMYNKRAFVHHFVGEGMEEGEFKSAMDDIRALESDYKTMFR